MRCLRSRRRAALTLIELLVVMMILSILATAVALSVVNKVHIAKVSTAKTDIHTFEQALNTYSLIMGEYPTSEEGLAALWSPPSTVDPEKWRQGGPFVEKQNFRDPWGNDYLYASPGADERPFDLSSYGADGKPGGDGKDADINNWEMGREPASQ